MPSHPSPTPAWSGRLRAGPGRGSDRRRRWADLNDHTRTRGHRAARCPCRGRRLRRCSGQVLFAGGPEIAVVDQPRLMEVVRTPTPLRWPACSIRSFPVPSSPPRRATSDGGSNPASPGSRHGHVSRPGGRTVRSCAIVSDRPGLAAACDRPQSRAITCHRARRPTASTARRRAPVVADRWTH